MYNTITKIIGDEGSYKIISNERQKDYGPIIKLSYKAEHGQSFKVSFVDDEGESFAINFVVNLAGAKYMLLIDYSSPNYLSCKNCFQKQY